MAVVTALIKHKIPAPTLCLSEITGEDICSPLIDTERYLQCSLLAQSGPVHLYALPSAFIRSYLAFRSSAGVGSFGDTGEANVRQTSVAVLLLST